MIACALGLHPALPRNKTDNGNELGPIHGLAKHRSTAQTVQWIKRLDLIPPVIQRGVCLDRIVLTLAMVDRMPTQRIKGTMISAALRRLNKKTVMQQLS